MGLFEWIVLLTCAVLVPVLVQSMVARPGTKRSRQAGQTNPIRTLRLVWSRPNLTLADDRPPVTPSVADTGDTTLPPAPPAEESGNLAASVA